MELVSDNCNILIVSGRPGSGKSTLSRKIATTLSCPLISRDDIYGAVALNHLIAGGDYLSDDENHKRKTFEVFFSTIQFYSSKGVFVIAESAFQDHMWRNGLGTTDSYHIKVIHCEVEESLARERVYERGVRDHDELSRLPSAKELLISPIKLAPRDCNCISFANERLVVNTTDGYEPIFEDIIHFILKA